MTRVQAPSVLGLNQWDSGQNQLYHGLPLISDAHTCLRSSVRGEQEVVEGIEVRAGLPFAVCTLSPLTHY